MLNDHSTLSLLTCPFKRLLRDVIPHQRAINRTIGRVVGMVAQRKGMQTSYTYNSLHAFTSLGSLGTSSKNHTHTLTHNPTNVHPHTSCTLTHTRPHTHPHPPHTITRTSIMIAYYYTCGAVGNLSQPVSSFAGQIPGLLSPVAMNDQTILNSLDPGVRRNRPDVRTTSGWSTDNSLQSQFQSMISITTHINVQSRYKVYS